MKLKITIGKDTFVATMEENATARAFRERLPLRTISSLINQRSLVSAHLNACSFLSFNKMFIEREPRLRD